MKQIMWISSPHSRNMKNWAAKNVRWLLYKNIVGRDQPGNGTLVSLFSVTSNEISKNAWKWTLQIVKWDSFLLRSVASFLQGSWKYQKKKKICSVVSDVAQTWSCLTAVWIITLSFILSVKEAEKSCFYSIRFFCICDLVISTIIHWISPSLNKACSERPLWLSELTLYSAMLYSRIAGHWIG